MLGTGRGQPLAYSGLPSPASRKELIFLLPFLSRVLVDSQERRYFSLVFFVYLKLSQYSARFCTHSCILSLDRVN